MFLYFPISQTNFHYPGRFEMPGYHCTLYLGTDRLSCHGGGGGGEAIEIKKCKLTFKG